MAMFCINALAGPSSKPFSIQLQFTRSASALTRSKNSAPFRGKLSKKGRVYPERKAQLVERYTELFKGSELLIFLRLQNTSVDDAQRLRTAITTIPNSPFKLTFLKANLLPPVLRALPTLPSNALQPHLTGPIAVLTASCLEPKPLKAFLAILDQHAARLNKALETPKGAVAAPTIEKLALLASVAESKEFDAAGIKHVASLPSLPELHAQLAGLISSPAAGLARLLQQAQGMDVVMTLEGFKKGKEDEAAGNKA